MKIITKEFLESFKIIDRVDLQPGLSSSQFVKLESKGDVLHMALTGLCVGESTVPTTESTGDWVWFVDRRILQAFLSSARTVTVSITQQTDLLRWVSGRQRITTAGMDAVTGYSHWNREKGAIKLELSPSLRKELAALAHYAPTTAAADHLAAVYLCKGYGALASDSFMVAVCLDTLHQRTFPLPVLLSAMIGDIPQIDLWSDKNGAGAKFPQGYLYQPLSANCLTSYPLKKIQSVAQGQMGVKPQLIVPAKVFLDALERMKGYIFGADTDLQITCQPSATAGLAILLMEVMQGKVQTAMQAQFVKDFKLQWLIAKVVPWVEYIAGLDKEIKIRCGQSDDCSVFSASINKKQHYLILAKNTP